MKNKMKLHVHARGINGLPPSVERNPAFIYEHARGLLRGGIKLFSAFILSIAFSFLFPSYLIAVPYLITDLKAETNSQIKLTWKAPNNGAGSACESYLVKYSSSADIVNDTDFINAATYYQNWLPLAPGATEAKILTGFIPDTTYWFSIKSSSNTVWSAISSTGTNACITGAFFLSWASIEEDWTTSIAWGDYDNDGDLDQLVGNLYVENRLYRNDGTNNFPMIWSSVELDDTNSITFGDYDNDGDLDQLVGNYIQENRIYRNDGENSFPVVWSSAEIDATQSIAFGDYDNDGDLDQLVGNYNQKNRIYRNDGSGQFAKIWDSFETDFTNSIAFGDYDNDGDLDQFVGNNNQKNRIYRNNGGNSFSLIWSSTEIDTTQSISFGDYDNDGDLDQLVGNYSQNNRIYQNDGSGQFVKIWDSAETDTTNSIAFGDYDNDGDLDQLVGNNIKANRVFKSEYSQKKQNTIPSEPTLFTADILSGELRIGWNYSTDSETTESKGLYYEIRMATQTITSSLRNWIISPSTGAGASPFMGNYSHGFNVAQTTSPGMNLWPPVENTTYY